MNNLVASLKVPFEYITSCSSKSLQTNPNHYTVSQYSSASLLYADLSCRELYRSSHESAMWELSLYTRHMHLAKYTKRVISRKPSLNKEVG